MFDVVKRRYLWFLVSLIIIVPGLISLAIFGLRLGIDFTGGTLWEIQLDQDIESAEMQQVINPLLDSSALVQTSEDGVVLIRMEEMQEGTEKKAALSAAIEEQFGEFTELRLETVGPTIGGEISERAMLAIGMASIAVLLYIAYAFRNSGNPFLYGVAAIVAMLHDVALVIGLFSILGWLADVEVDSLFVTAVLTLIGFSVHDTIVVFDRIRENLVLREDAPFEEVVNFSIVQTMPRSINTSLTTLVTLAALLLFGGETIRYFVLALFVGILAGTYSSIFNAAQILVVWRNREVQRFLGLPEPEEQPAES